MTRAPTMRLSYADWPPKDRALWTAANKLGADPFDDCGPAAHLAEPSRRAFQGAYGRFLGFVALKHPELLGCPPERRLDRKIIAEYVAFRAPTCSASGIAIDLHHLRLALRLLCPRINWSWLATITTCIAASAKRKPQKHSLMTSERLYALGIGIMSEVTTIVAATGVVTKADAFAYRDGLLIALVASIPLRRRTTAALRIRQRLVKIGSRWELDIPAKDVKTKRPLDYPLSDELSGRIDVYLSRFRCCIPGAMKHDGLWPSNKGRPMDDGTIYDTVRRRTTVAFGFPVNLHRFRTAAGTLWSIHDPGNVRGVKDLLGHDRFGTTEKYYIMTLSRIAGLALARAIGTVSNELRPLISDGLPRTVPPTAAAKARRINEAETKRRAPR